MSSAPIIVLQGSPYSSDFSLSDDDDGDDGYEALAGRVVAGWHSVDVDVCLYGGRYRLSGGVCWELRSGATGLCYYNLIEWVYTALLVNIVRALELRRCPVTEQILSRALDAEVRDHNELLECVSLSYPAVRRIEALY